MNIPHSNSKMRKLNQAFIRKNEELTGQRHWIDALKHAENFVVRFPESRRGLLQCWNILIILGELEAAVDLLQKGEKTNGLCRRLFSRYISVLHGSSKATRDDIRDAHRVFSKRFFNPKSGHAELPKNPLQRVGLLSGEMRDHAAANFLQPLLRGLVDANVDILAYSTSPSEDQRTDTFKELSSNWSNFHGISAKEAAAQIESDKPDILLNCDWHLPHNRLDITGALTGIPQIDYLQAGTTGIPQIPYNLTDEILNPINEGDYWLGQKNLHLDGGAHVFKPFTGEVIIPQLKREWKGRLLIGSCNHLTKLNDRVIRCWAQILKLNPNVKLLLKSINLDLPEVQERLLARFHRCGITADRLNLLGFTPNYHLNYQLLNKLSIGLDPFPYNGVTTTCDALWMGVPVVTLSGDRPIARKASSLLHQIGASELITYDEESYIEKVTELIGDQKMRTHYHKKLRRQMLASPLCDIERMARSFKGACSSDKLLIPL